MNKINFKQFRELLSQNFEALTDGVSQLYEVDVDKDRLWNLYLDSFPNGTNVIFRGSREYDCSYCRHFIKNFGNVVVIKDGIVKTIWDFETGSKEFQPVVEALNQYIKDQVISDINVSKFKRVGVQSNRELLDDGEILNWDHFYIELDDKFVDKSNRSEGDIKGSARDLKNVFKRSLDEIGNDSVQTVLELIYQNSLYKGNEWKSVLESFKDIQNRYNLLNDEQKQLFAWSEVFKVGVAVAKIRNHSIGALLINISEGMDLETAVKKYESIVAPENYKRPKPIFTERMLKSAQEKLIKLGYIDSLPRRHATLEDISINDILFSNKDSAKQMKSFDIFEDMSNDIPINPKKFDRVEEISIQDFIKNVLPSVSNLEAFVENKNIKNMVSLIAPQNEDSPSMFKWKNPFSWAYTGNITDSSMRDRVKSVGGDVEGDLRFSIQWNDGKQHDINDLDAHCITPNEKRIFYRSKNDRETQGFLDVDNTDPTKGVVAVENITWKSRTTMTKGVYRFLVKNFAHRGGREGFRAEIEFDGQVYSFDYNQNIKDDQEVLVAEVKLDTNNNFTIEEKLKSTSSSKDIWNIQTNQFVPVSVIMNSPNHWEREDGIGHNHFMFMLRDCINTEKPNGIFNEFMNNELIEHRNVIEALGSRLAVDESPNQLSGLGFSDSKRDELIVKAIGQTERLLKIKF